MQKSGIFSGLLARLARRATAPKRAVDPGPGEAPGPAIRKPDIDAAVRMLKESCAFPKSFVRPHLSQDRTTLILEVQEEGEQVLFVQFGKDEAGMFLRSIQTNYERMRYEGE